MKTYDTGNVQDFQGEQEAVARALRNAQALKQQAYGGVPSNANPFHYLANYMSQRNADAEMEAAEKRFGDVSQRERTDANDLIAQLTAPQNKTVLSQTLGGSDAPLGGQNVAPMTETQQPMNEVEAAQARLPLAMKAMQNPRAQAIGQAIFTQGINAPIRAEEKAAAVAARAAEKEDQRNFQARQDEIYRRNEATRSKEFGQTLAATMAGINARVGSGNQELKDELLRARIDQMKAPKPPTAQEVIAAGKEYAKEEGRVGLGETTSAIAQTIDKLDKAGGMVKTGDGALSNIATATATSPLGQTLSRVVGTKAQEQRDVLGSLKKQLLLDIKQATGMGSGQLNSNVELQTWLSSLGSDGMSKEANVEILNNIEKKYLGKGAAPATPPGGAIDFGSLK